MDKCRLYSLKMLFTVKLIGLGRTSDSITHAGGNPTVLICCWVLICCNGQIYSCKFSLHFGKIFACLWLWGRMWKEISLTWSLEQKMKHCLFYSKCLRNFRLWVHSIFKTFVAPMSETSLQTEQNLIFCFPLD